MMLDAGLRALLPDLVAASDTGVSSSDNLTSDRTPVLTGSVRSAATQVRLFIDGRRGDLLPVTNRAWSYEVPATAALSAGRHTFAVRPVDSSGRVGPLSRPLTVTIEGAPLAFATTPMGRGTVSPAARERQMQPQIRVKGSYQHNRMAVWQGAMAGPHGTAPDATIRQLLMVSTDASSIRVRFSNHFGATALTIREAWAGVPVASSTARLVGDSNKRVTFDGRGTVTIPAGEQAWSDPIRMRVKAGDQVALSIYAPQAPITSKNFFAYAYAPPGMYISIPGNHAREKSGLSFPARTVDDTDDPRQNVGYHPGQVWWTDVIAGRSNSRGTVVIIGDSVSEGWMAYGPPGQRWTDVLATRLNALPARKRLSVANAAISGNTVSDQQNPYEQNSDCCGQPAVIRLDRDALSIPGVRAIILLEGTNDIGGGPFAPPSPPEQVIAAMQDIVDRAHARGVPVIGGTLIPMGKEPTSVQETSRQAVNAWIRTSGTFDAVIDFDQMVLDPQQPWQIYPAWQAPPFNGNFYHPNAMGHAVMGQQIPLGVFAVAR